MYTFMDLRETLIWQKFIFYERNYNLLTFHLAVCSFDDQLQVTRVFNVDPLDILPLNVSFHSSSKQFTSRKSAYGLRFTHAFW